MAFDLKTKQEEREKHAKRMHALYDQVKDGTGDAWTDEQRQEFDSSRDAVAKIDDEIEQYRADQERMADAARLRNDDRDPDEPQGRNTDGDVITRQDQQNALKAILLHPTGEARTEHLEAAAKCGINPAVKKLRFALSKDAPKTRADIKRIYDQVRAQSVGTATAGGHLVPDEMMEEIEIALLKFARLRQFATIIRTSTGADLPIPTCDDTSNEGELITENSTANEQDVTLGQVVLGAYKFSSKMVRASIELLMDSATNVEVFLGRLLGERIGRSNATYFTTGTGSSQPEGVVTGATDSGVSLASNTAITYDELVDIQHAVDEAYRDDATWMLADATLKQVRKVKDSDGNPLWMPGLADGMPATILGSPYGTNSKMPTGASAKSIIYGDLSKLHIRDVMDFDLVRLDERYAELAQVAFLGWQRSDSKVVDAGSNPIVFATAAA